MDILTKRNIKLSTNLQVKCDFCCTHNLSFAYTPINSSRGMQVHVCDNCGLVQSISTSRYESRPPGSMSADADRSSFRYTKDVISGRYDSIFEGYVDFSAIKNVLDVGSNRGAFINYLDQRYPGKLIEAIEPDKSVVHEYIDRANVHVQICRFENSTLPENYFDFAYCAHTLEHASSARLMLNGIKRSLRPGGKFFLAVPNLLFYKDVIEEIFIDPHTYHFNYLVLREYAEQLGFDVEFSGAPEDHEIMLLLRKRDDLNRDQIFNPSNLSLAMQNINAIDNYGADIQNNRQSLKNSVARLNAASKNNRIVIWGGGRIFDALMRFGDLDLSRIYMVVDKYLHKYVKELHGKPLMSPTSLAKLDNAEVLVYVASREYALEIEAEARALGIKNFIHFGENI